MRIVSCAAGGFGRVEGDAFVPMGADILDWLRTGRVDEWPRRALSGIELAAPVPLPGKVVCVGLNYRDHAAETGAPLPEIPVLFAKFASSVSAHNAVVEVPPDVSDIDYEAELGIVIGSTACRVSEAEALGCVAGYTCLNDLTSRSLQFATSQWFLGKSVDGFLPMGPSLVTADEVGDPQSLRIRCFVNDVCRQDSTTSEMIFGVAALVSFVSRTITLEPGDVIATGTPPGVGMAATPPTYLSDGDEVVVEIEKVGRLATRIALGAPEHRGAAGFSGLD